MNLFDEFFSIVEAFRKHAIPYAVVGGIAMAFHDEPRFTRDIDLLVTPDDEGRVRQVLETLAYFEASPPWTFSDTELSLHRFIKTHGEDHLVVDILFGVEDRYQRVIDRAIDHPWANGSVRVSAKEDLVWMKRQRNSAQDQLDIERLRDDEDREGAEGTQ